MDKFDTRSAKLLGIIIFILLVFTLVIAHAFNYLPSETTDIPNIYNEEIQPDNNTDNYQEETTNKEDDNEKENSYQNKTNTAIEKKVSKENYSNIEVTPLENISDNGDNGYTNNNSSFDESFAKAKQLKNNKQFVDAIEEFKNALNFAENSQQKADCYEQIALINAMVKKYGTALSYAQRAYVMAPSTSRELLLARLYYKTGDIDKSNYNINNILKRDFNSEN